MVLSDLLLLGQGSDLASERGVSCTGEIPAASDESLVERARSARAALGDCALVLGHCSVHGLFTVNAVEAIRSRVEGG